MTQIVIDIGAVPNDGTGDPLRTAFNDVNLNFANVFAAGPVDSNVRIANNAILTTNTNGNLVLNPNGVGVVQANAHVVPDQNRVRNLGSQSRLWDTTYTQYLQATYATIGTANIGNIGVINIPVANLHILGGSNGYVLQTDGTGNLTWTAQTGGSGNGVPGGANTQIQYNNAGSFGASVGFTFNSTSNALSVPGNVTAQGNISGNIIAPGYNQDVVFNKNGVLGTTSSGGFNFDDDNRTLYVYRGSFNGDGDTGAEGLYAGVSTFTVLGSNIMAQFTGNTDAYSQVNLQNISDGTGASGDYIVTADNGDDATYYIDLGLAGSNHADPDFFGDTSTANDGYLYVVGADETGPGGAGPGNLILGSTNGVIKMFVGNTAQANVVATVDLNGLNVNIGNLTVPGNIQSINTLTLSSGGQFNICTILTGGSGYGGGGSFSATTGGSGTGLTVGYGYGLSGQVVNASVIDPGDGNYQDGDVITMTAGNGAATFVLTQYNVLGNQGNNNFVQSNWSFDAAGGTVFPTLTIPRGDEQSSTITGQTLLFGDATQEAIISTPDGNPTDGINSQRLVINPGEGYDSGEGGDIYLWAGRGGNNNGSGGDVKIRGGYAPADGTGGYIRMDGGESQGNGAPGFIEITGGQGGTTSGGYVQITGGVAGSGTGGAVDIIGGFGQAGPGAAVTITGGGSANGLAEYGNVNISAGASTWQFGNDGTTTLPTGNITSDTSLQLTTTFGNYRTVEYQTAGVWDVYVEDVATGPNDAWSWIDVTFKDNLINKPQVFIENQKASDGIALRWTFDENGNLTLPSNIASINYANGAPYGGSGGPVNTGNVTFNDQAVIGTGDQIGGSGLYLAPGTESVGNLQYLRVRGGDYPTHIHFDTGNNQYFDQYLGDDYKYVLLSNTGNIVINTDDYAGNSAQWTFGVDGNLTVPGNLLGGGNILIAPDSANSGGYLDIYLSTGPDVHVASNGDSNLILGRDNSSNVTVNTNGNVTIQANTSTPHVWTFDSTGNLTAPGNIIAAGSGGDIALTGGDITGANNISVTGNITAANFFGNTLSQTILPTIQSIAISNTSSEYETSGGTGYANVLVANVIPVTEYGIIVTAGSTVDKYVIGNLGNIPGTEKITISTGVTDQPFTVYAYVTSNAGTYYSGPEIGFSGLCLLKGTMISLADGTYKAIEDIDNDDLLLTWDFDLGRYAQARPLWIKRSETGTRYNQLTFSDGTILRTFDQHRIFNQQAGAFTYPMSDDTPIGTVTVNEHGQEITLVKRDIVWDTIEHYNIITNHHINLFANSVLTSCRFNNIYPITNMKFVKDAIVNRSLSEFAEIESRFVSGLRLQEQSFELAMIEEYVNRLLATEATELIGV